MPAGTLLAFVVYVVVKIVVYVFRVFFLLFVSLFVASCTSNKASLYVFSGHTMGTTYTVKLHTDLASSDIDSIERSVAAGLNQVNESMSTYKVDSELSRFNRQSVGAPFIFTEAAFKVIEYAQAVSRLSNGAFDITVGPLVALWGFGSDGPVESVPSDSDISVLLDLVGFNALVLDGSSRSVLKTRSVQVDLSAIAKGYAVDEVVQELEKAGVKNFLVEVGGETRTRGVNQKGDIWRLGIERPDQSGRAIVSVVQVPDMALATSGDYRNYFESGGKHYSHTISPVTGRPVEHNLASVSVLAESCMEADALATALLVMGEEKGYNFAQENNLKAYFIYRNQDAFEVRMTDGFEPYLL